MSKVRDVLCAVSVLWISAAICQNCEYQMELWANDDPTKFFYCNPYTNQSAIGDCNPGKGFVRNGTITGCVNWIDWNDNCVNKVDVSTITCEGEGFLYPHEVVDPEEFYLCLGQNTTAVPLRCPQGRAFYAKDQYLGCFPWKMWRDLTGCQN